MTTFKNNGKLKLLIIVGTRPEIIRLAAVIDITHCRTQVIAYGIQIDLGISQLQILEKNPIQVVFTWRLETAVSMSACRRRPTVASWISSVT